MKRPSDRADGLTLRVVLLASALPVLLAWILFVFDVPYGRSGVLVYHYSQLPLRRLISALIAIAVTCAAVLVLRRRPVSDGAVLAIPCVTFLGIWTLLAPPAAIQQHFFALRSVAQEGAFVIEAGQVDSLSDYLRDFPASLQRRSVGDMRGARVLSNPPGVTMLAFWSERFVVARPGFARWLIEVHGGDFPASSSEGRAFAQAMMLVWLLTLAWLASAALLYALARLWLEPLHAATVMLICWFNPASVNFSPGKDPAQLLTIAATLYTLFAAWRRGRRWLGFLSGLAFSVGLAFGIIHAWIAIIALSALLWTHRRDRTALRRIVTCALLPGAAGVALATGAARIIWGWNIPATLVAVTASYYRSADIPPWGWNLAKPPMFALFAGAGVWILGAIIFRSRASDAPARLGRALVLITLGVVLLVCPSTALETPRLWMAFLPTLVLGLALWSPAFRTAPGARLDRLWLLIVLQVVTTCLNWCLFDVRESEMRLLSGRLFE